MRGQWGRLWQGRGRRPDTGERSRDPADFWGELTSGFVGMWFTCHNTQLFKGYSSVLFSTSPTTVYLENIFITIFVTQLPLAPTFPPAPGRHQSAFRVCGLAFRMRCVDRASVIGMSLPWPHV